jgi:hypothetical protein
MRLCDGCPSAQGERSVSPVPATKRIGCLRKTTRRSWVHVQSVGLSAERKRKIFRHRAEGRVFLLTSPYIGRLRDNSCARQLRVFCFSGSSQKAAACFGSSVHSLPGAPITRAETGEKTCTYMLSGIVRARLANSSIIKACFEFQWPLPERRSATPQAARLDRSGGSGHPVSVVSQSEDCRGFPPLLDNQ